MRTCRLFAVLVALAVGIPFSSMADGIPLVYDVENTGTNCAAPPLPPFPNPPIIQPLPDPFAWANGSGRSTNFTDWRCRRSEIKAQIENYEIGTKPPVDLQNIFASYSAGVLTVRVTNTVSGTNRTLTLTCTVLLPAGSGPFPAVIGMNSPNGSIPSALFTNRNIARIVFSHNQVTTYGNQQNTDPYYQLYGTNLNSINTGQYSAWAWGVSRIIDGLYLVTNTLPIDVKHLCVTGCSYAGKMALFSGAFDERIALTIAQESGGGGATSWRYSHTEDAGSVESLENTDHNWFSESMFQFGNDNVSRLPIDHHELMAMCAPRALLVTANPDYTWLSNPSCYVCSRATQQIYNTLGIPDRFGFSIVGGHAHCTLPTSQYDEIGAFLDKFLLSSNVVTQIATYSVDYNSINYTRWYQWWGTGNPIFPEVRLKVPSAATEGDGTLVGKGEVSVPVADVTDLAVNLASSDTSVATVPASVTIPAGATNVVFDIGIVDDALLDGDRVATISASAPGRDPDQAAITVHDNETATLSVTLPASASEGAGTLVNAGMVSVSTPVNANFTVLFNSSDPSKLLVPAVLLTNGQSAVAFNLILVSNNIVEGPKTVSVTAHVNNWTDGSASMSILDDDPLPDHFAWSVVPSPQWTGNPFGVVVTAQDAANQTVDYRLPVTLSAFVPGNTAGTNSILNSAVPDHSITEEAEYVLGYSFKPNKNLKVTHVRHYFGDKVTIWTTSGQPLVTKDVVSVPGSWVDTPLTTPLLLAAGGTYLITVHVNGLEYFWSESFPATFADGTINQSWWDFGDVFPTQVDAMNWYFVDLRYATDFVSVPIVPGTSGIFSGGAWSGNVTVPQAGTNVILQASAGSGHSGGSSPFDVLSAPKLAISSIGDSVVVSWPTVAAGFNLERASALSNWTSVAETPAVVGDRYMVTNGVGPAPAFYRLRKP